MILKPRNSYNLCKVDVPVIQHHLGEILIIVAYLAATMTYVQRS